MDYIRQFYDGNTYDFKNKKEVANLKIAYMFARTQSMFKYDGLPDTVPSRMLELMVQSNGHVAWYKVGSDLRVFIGAPGGEPDVYLRPTKYVIANPTLDKSITATINKDCVIMSNDSMHMGLRPMFTYYASAMAENELSLHIASILSRIPSAFSAHDDRTRQSAEKFIKDIIDGEIGVVFGNSITDGLKSTPYNGTANARNLTDLIEYEQYLKASWFNDLGLNANYNMKRESLNTSESQLNNDALLPLIDDMLRCRTQALERVNDMFGTNISVSLDSSWEDNQQEVEMEHTIPDVRKDDYILDDKKEDGDDE